MERREFLMAAGAVAAEYQMRNAERGTRNRMPEHLFRVPTSDFRVIPSQEPSLPPEVFARRLERARSGLKGRGLDLPIPPPAPNYKNLPGSIPGRSDRRIPLLLPSAGPPPTVCPPFESS